MKQPRVRSRSNAERAKVQKLSVVLLKKQVRDFAQALKDPSSLRPVRLVADFKGAALFVQRSPPLVPSWSAFLTDLAAEDLDLSAKVSESAVLFVRAQGRILAWMFGYGRHLLRDDAYERGFGRKVVLNRVHPERLRSVDLRTIEANTLDSRLQLSREAPATFFGFDFERNLLRAVTGSPADRNFALRFTGADGLSFSRIMAPRRLPQVSRELLAAYASEEYKKKFEWVDFIKPVSDPQRISYLNEALVNRLRKDDVGSAHLSPNSPLDWASIEGFTFSGEPEDTPPRQNLEIEDLLTHLQDEELTYERLAEMGVMIHEANAAPRELSSVIRSLIFELKQDGKQYILSDGEWYEIESSFARAVDRAVSRIPHTTGITFPKNELRNEHGKFEMEDAINKWVTAHNPGSVLMDKKLIRISRGYTAIEFCDVMLPKGQMVHVKWNHGAGDLSHLFNQGQNAASLFLGEPAFRKKVREKIRDEEPGFPADELIPEERPDPSGYELVFGVLEKKERKEWPGGLPFFSRLSLYKTHRAVSQTMGIHTTIAQVSPKPVK